MARQDQTASSDEELPPQKGLCEGDTDIIENVLPKELEEGVFDKLREEIHWQRMSHQGGEVPRLVAVQGEVAKDGSMPIYRHPADESPPLLPFSPTVLAIKAATEKHLGHSLNHVLIQYYRDGKDHISEHSDKTLDIVKESYIANVSLGAERIMVLRTKRLDKDRPPPDAPSKEGTPRKTQRARLPHNSLCRMGLKTNMKWLHAIRQDKRAEREKTKAELAFAGGRISLTFRQIGTFLDKDETIIWGQGATGKTREEAKAIINGTGAEAIDMIKAFGAENNSSTFDWEVRYGEGFDVLHMSNSPRFFSSSDPMVNMRIALMLTELGIEYAKGSMGPAASHEGEDADSDPLPIKFVDNDSSKSSVSGDVAILMYLEAIYGRDKDGKAGRDAATSAKVYTRFQEALVAFKTLQKQQKATKKDKVDFKPFQKVLSPWNTYAAETDKGFLAGPIPSLPDFVIWPALYSLFEKYGESLFEGLDSLKKYYEMYGARETTKTVVEKTAQADKS